MSRKRIYTFFLYERDVSFEMHVIMMQAPVKVSQI